MHTSTYVHVTNLSTLYILLCIYPSQRWYSKLASSDDSLSYTPGSKFRLVMSLVLGQVLSLLLCGTGVTSQLLQTSHSIHVPTTQSFINYTLLTAVFGVSLATRKDFMQVLWKNWWKYVILGVIDVEANYMIVRAYEYTNLTTIQVFFAVVYVLQFCLVQNMTLAQRSVTNVQKGQKRSIRPNF